MVRSKKIIPNNTAKSVTGREKIPDVHKLACCKNMQDLQNLTITQVQWKSNSTIGFTLNDGQNCKVGRRDFSRSHTFDPAKKITRVETLIHKDEDVIIQIYFYHHQQKLVQVGWENDGYVKRDGGRIEVFEIADDEQFIGCELDHDKNYFRGVTWLTIKRSVWLTIAKTTSAV